MGWFRCPSPSFAPQYLYRWSDTGTSSNCNIASDWLPVTSAGDVLPSHHPGIVVVRFLIRCHGHYSDVIMGAITSQITSITIVYSIVYSDADQRKHQSSASLDFVQGIHRGPVNSRHKWPVTRKMLPFDDVIMFSSRFVVFTLYPWNITFIFDKCHHDLTEETPAKY